ncbi:MAG TPA: monovalent cation/H+ antiporter complex subunit F [Pseudonocardia sp.]|jgi:multicomponent Na+:H+ antiporter subunit F|nr:monovalent cation/H+ antiporter complex subunit F [Pseudonocardia sp.]
MTPPPVLVGVSLALLGLGALFCLIRAVLGPTALDRVVALDVFLVVVAAGIVVRFAGPQAELTVVVLLVIALLAFVGSASVARLVERRER